jgi:enoyl-CoA hydratase/carnithine racemase
MAADLRIAKSNGGKMGLPEVALGVLPGTGGTQRLARLLGKSKAMELMVKGSNFSFDTALGLGLINETLPAEGFAEAALDYAKQFVPPNKASMAVGFIKRAVTSGLEMSFGEGLTLERELQQQLFRSGDAKEGIQAYVEKRQADFQGE